LEQRAQILLGREVEVLADARPLALGLLDRASHEVVSEGAGRARTGVPVDRGDLPAREADQGIAVADAVVEEGELVVAGKGREPQRQLAELRGHGVLVDAVEAALGDLPLSVEQYVLVRRQ